MNRRQKIIVSATSIFIVLLILVDVVLRDNVKYSYKDISANGIVGTQSNPYIIN